MTPISPDTLTVNVAEQPVFDGAQDSYGGGGGAALGMPMRV